MLNSDPNPFILGVSGSGGGGTPTGSHYDKKFVAADWLGASAPYYQSFTRSVHGQPAKPSLSVITKELDGTWYKDCFCDPKTNDAGDVLIYSQTKFDGLIVIGVFSGGALEGGHATSLTLTDTVTGVEYDIIMANGTMDQESEVV